jgi:hypothetical protein
VVSKGPIFETGERETWNISITDQGEFNGSAKQELSDQAKSSGSSSLAGKGKRPGEESVEFCRSRGDK